MRPKMKVFNVHMTSVSIYLLTREGFKNKKWMNLASAHLTPAIQVERWIKKNLKKIKKLRLYYLYNYQIWREL